jgi:hypothetical protein
MLKAFVAQPISCHQTSGRCTKDQLLGATRRVANIPAFQ